MNDAVRILLIEDTAASEPDKAAGWLGEAYPEAKLYCVETMDDYKEALSIFMPDIVLSEYALPLYDGREALAYTVSRSPGVPLVFLTDALCQDEADDCLRAGALDVISKKKRWRVLLAVDRCISQKSSIFEYKQTLETLQESEERHKSILEVMPVAVCIYTDGVLSYTNPAGVRLFGAESADQVIGMPMTRLMPPDSMDAAIDRIRKLRNGNTVDTPTEDVCHRLDGTLRVVETTVSLIRYMEQNAVQVIMNDITERQKAEEDFRYLSYHDHLTGLYNRRFFEMEIVRSDKPENLPVSVIIADLNGLKRVNDTFGHDMGDLYIVKAAEAIVQGCREGDIAARIGGDEYAVILRKTDAQEADMIISEIERHAEASRVPDGKLTISMGYATKRIVNEKITLVLTQAENSMYKKKRSGRSG
jgi:diguanylate cyclase (GGDEF)-like protein/PAS domain S-box-containing protein